MRIAPIVAAIACVVVIGATAASAQWIEFVEDPSRLELAPFADDPTPLNDDQEKDIAVADLNQDGWDDVIVVRKFPFSTPGTRQDVLLMNESGILVDRTATLAPEFITNLTDARDVFIGDFTGDGWDDVVIANTFGQQPTFYLNLGLDGGNNWLGLRDESTLRLPTISGIPALQFCAVWGGDVTGNGALDIYFSNYRQNGGTTDVLLINNGLGVFTDESSARLGSFANVAFGTSAEIHDMDNDGDNDIVKISTLYSAPPFGVGQFILFNDGSGVFNSVPFQTLSTNQPYMFAVGDLTNNGMLDLFLEGDSQDRVSIAQSMVPDSNINYATVTLQNSPRTSGFGGNTKLADVDGDGDLDVGVGPIDVDIQNCGSSSDFALLQNSGSGISDPYPSPLNFHTNPHDFGFLDINADGCMDMFMGLCTGWRVFIQDGCAAPSLTLSASGSCPGAVTVDVAGATPSGNVTVVRSFAPGSFTIPVGPCAGTVLDVGSPSVIATPTADANGDASISGNAPAALCGVSLQAIDLDTCQTSNVTALP